ncbi:MAG TPA: chemotaxis protein [Syntrophothermus lipocalidus]|uniref:Methyl-accepting chemotaxis sensory transducer n=1 Tax=Syntrophothermus lipocalidus (strain DSM 12680 / TGB-C1) TaxID=643648 RepID=D7CP54_SYNLT|nr:methyl-accepting chemotaxis protein [Syntrophothermus lipocalidus]ADI02489.1 methyl-accepting chemotaxis sensory transducer [Syntrophothermus lipocalidus DSM 12680]HHV77294.1 chemotaxis protein [Syntrophothermus lipocalidus]
MARRLETPPGAKTGLTLKTDEEDISKKREQARRMAQEKARARTLAKQQAMAERIATASEQLLAGVEEATASAQEFARMMTDLAVRMQQVAEMSESVKQTAQDESNAAQQVVETFDILYKITQEGLGTMRESVAAMENMRAHLVEAAEKNAQSGKRIAELEEQSRQIGDIVQTVVMIADQTNLLALNAAIEAARAGEHGRGFAVVADEVRNLAEISESAARDIRGVVEEIRSGVDQVVKDINQVVESFQDMQQRTEHNNQGFQGVAQRFQLYGEILARFLDFSGQMDRTAQEVRSVCESIAANTDQIRVGCEESTKAVTEQSKALAEVNQATHELAEMADELKTSTNVNKSAEEVAATSEQLSANIEEISSSASEIVSSLSQMTNAASLSEKDVQKVVTLVHTSQELLAKMNECITQASQTLGELQQILTDSRQAARAVWRDLRECIDSYQGTNSSIETLEEKIRRIEKIVDTIENVSIQTNMLAVNGFVEAATAGEHGRGFSVVAGDIRNLATESAENADKIKDLVRDLQKQMSKVIADLGQSESVSRQADEAIGVAAKKNDEVEESLAQITHQRAQVGKAVTDIRNAVEKAEKLVEALTEMITAGFAEIQAASRTADEQARGVAELANSIEEIASIADELQAGQ